MDVASTVFDCSLPIISAFVVVVQVLLATTSHSVSQSTDPI